MTSNVKHGRFRRIWEPLWPLSGRTEQDSEFEHVHLPDEGHGFLKPPFEMLIEELEDISTPEQKEAEIRLQRGEQCFKHRQYRNAAAFYRASYESSESLSALLARGVALMMVSELTEAAEIFEEGRNLSRRREAGRLEAAFGINLGQVCNDLGEPDRSREALEGARDLCGKIEDPALEATALRHLGTIFLAQASYSNALACCEEAIQISEGIGDKISVGHILCNKGVFLASKGNLNDAEEIFRQGLMLGQGLEDPYIQGRVYTNRASLDLIRGKLQEATSALERALDIHRSISYGQGEARNLGMLAMIQTVEGKFQEGDQTFEQAIEIDRQSGYRRGEARALLMLARVQLQNNQLQKAYQLFQIAYDIADEMHHQHIQVEASAMLTLLMPDAQIEDGISMLEAAIELSRSVCNPVLEIQISSHLGLLLLNSGQWEEAIRCSQQAVAYSQEIGNLFEEAKSLMNLAHVYDQQGETELAVKNVSIAQALFQSQSVGISVPAIG